MITDDKEKDKEKVQVVVPEVDKESSESTFSATKYNLPIREWVPIKVGENRTSGTTTTSTQITGDVTGWDKPTDFNFKAPVREKYVYDPNSGFMSALKPPEPERDVEREERMKKVARVNAFGDFMKHLGDFSGGGYAPTEKRTENQNVLRALREVDKMQDLYAAQKEKHNDKLFGLRVQDYTSQEARSDREYDRKYNEDLNQAKLRYQADENRRQMKEKAYWEGNTKRTQEQNGKVEQYKNGDLLMAELMAKKKTGSGKGPYSRIQFKHSNVVLDAEEWQMRQAIAELKNIYADALSKGSRHEPLNQRDQQIVNDIGMLDAAMESGNNNSAIKDLSARYIEMHWDKMNYIWKNVHAMRQDLPTGVEKTTSTIDPKSGEKRTGTLLPK